MANGRRGFGVPGGLKLGFSDLPVFNFQTSELVESMKKGVRHMALQLRLTATVSISGGSSDGTVRDNSTVRLIDRLQILLGDVVIADLSGLQILELTKRHARQGLTLNELSGASTSVSSEDIEAELVIPFSPNWLEKPFECHLGPVAVDEVLDVRVTWNDDAAGSGSSDDGTGALIDGGDRDVTFDTEPELVATQVYAPTGPAPVFLPMFRTYSGENFSAEDESYQIPIRTRRPIGHMVLRAFDAADGGENPVDLIDRVTVGDRADWHRQRFATLSMIERENFPGVPSTDVGTVGILFADGGKGSNRLLPQRDLERDAIELEVSDPSGGTTPARVEAIVTHLVQQQGITRGTFASAEQAQAARGNG